MYDYRVEPLGDSAIRMVLAKTISPEVNEHIRKVMWSAKNYKGNGIIEWVPTYTGVTVHYDPASVSWSTLKSTIKQVMETAYKLTLPAAQIYDIPVCYGGEFGSDLKKIAHQKGMKEEEVIALHSNRKYLIFMLGFTPGFPYLGGMDEKLATPRLDTPRTFVEKGSVGIAGIQTGVYPVASPGGWNIIGRTPIPLFNPQRENPVLLEAGAFLRFYPITRQEYEEISMME
ncbi:5-oxoprolinase subunit PxpB [Alteribacillus iranensis]|uniref:Inhibitor of KinA n=1 Tax=Alteribacillus iranensis TaxID=930128 RepID=A0A1I2EEA5_9BACI|nr:5-oxoprolinase subunit PxpB [Alteribacillus iranensis]SFE90570.1 inhibitor of KinA [Alteribacillus iranensis]